MARRPDLTVNSSSSRQSPWWPGGADLNPIGGALAIFILAIIFIFQRNALAIAGRPLTGARSASSRGARP